MLRTLATFIFGSLMAVFANVSVTWALLNAGANDGDADLAGNIVFALLFGAALWLALRGRPRKEASP